MKILSYIQKVTFFSIIGLIVFFSACKQKDDTSAPSLDHVRRVRADSIILGDGNGSAVAIIGKHLSTTHKVYFNDVEADLRPTFITETTIIVTIPSTAPFKGGSNLIKVVTKFGEATIPFRVIQPAAVITGFTPGGSPGDTITITGTVFDDADSVTIADINAKILSVTPTEIKAIIPGGVTKGLITVRTPGGKTKSTNGFGFGYIIYDDAHNANWYDYAYNATEDNANTQKVRVGKNSIKMVYSGGALGFGIWNGAEIIDPSKYTTLKLSAFLEGNDPAQVLFGIKDKSHNIVNFKIVLDLKPGVWNDFYLDLKKDLNNVDIIREFEIQDYYKNAKHPTVYFDEIGLY